MTTPKPRFWLTLIAAMAAAGVGVYAAKTTGDWVNFARSGAVIVIIGAIATAFDVLRSGNNPLMFLSRWFSPDRLPSETLGLILLVLGTLIWSFGDLAGNLL